MQLGSNNSEALGHDGGREACASSVVEGCNVDGKRIATRTS